MFDGTPTVPQNAATCTCLQPWHSITPKPPCPVHHYAPPALATPCPHCGHCPACGHTAPWQPWKDQNVWSATTSGTARFTGTIC